MRSDKFEMFESAEVVLLEFGGLHINQNGAGVTCAREPFTFDPTLAAGESDRFTGLSSFVSSRLYPLGEAAGGQLFWAIGENGRVYLLMEEISLVGKNIDEALERLLIGLEAERLS